MRVTEFLDKSAVHYEVSEHAPAFTSQQMAAVEHEQGRYVAKPVIIKADGKYIMCVLAACYKNDLGALKSQFGAKSVELATEKEIGSIFDDCDLGADMICRLLWTRPWRRTITSRSRPARTTKRSG